MIGQDTIDRVREQTNIVELIGALVKLERRGRSYVGLCPFHREKTPSFHVNDERGFYHCFGCQASGDAIKFVQETEGLDFADAIRQLAERLGIQVTETRSEKDRQRDHARKREQDALYDVGKAAAELYTRLLREHPLAHHARAELERRGLEVDGGDERATATLRAFQVGYAPYGWDTLVKHLRASGLSHQAAEKVGLLAARKQHAGHYDRFRHRLMFAVHDLSGRIIAFSGRSLPMPPADELRELGLEPPTASEPPAKYVNSPESPIYRKREAVFGLFQSRQALRREQHCIVVEGNFDVVSLHARGIENVVAPLGTAFTREQAKMIRRFCPEVVLAFDGDSAGKRAVESAREPLREMGLLARVAALPDGTDPDEWVRSKGPQAFTSMVRAAPGILEHLIDAILDAGFRSDDAQTKAAKIQQVLALLSAEDDPATRALAEQHANRIAQRLGIADAPTLRALGRSVKQALSRGEHPPQQQIADLSPRRARSVSDPARIGREILGALLDYPELLEAAEIIDNIDLLEGDAAAAFAALRQELGGGGGQIPEQVLAKMPGSIHSFARARLAAPRHTSLEDAKKVLFGNVKILKGLELARHSVEAVEESQRAARVGDFDRELELLQESQRRARERHGL